MQVLDVKRSGMIVIGLADVHGDASSVARTLRAIERMDLVVLSGDLTHFGKQAQAIRAVEAVRKECDKILAVSGNCDYPDVEDYLIRSGISLNRRCVLKDGYAFVGISGSLPCPGGTPNEASESEFRRWLNEAVGGVPEGAPMILVAHQPPRDTVNDRIHSGIHVGSTAVRQFIEERQPLVCLTAHIHEGTGIDTIGKTTIVNPGQVREGRYVYLELQDGEAFVEIRRA
jgi:Icc-related predicted phosphoesterase